MRVPRVVLSLLAGTLAAVSAQAAGVKVGNDYYNVVGDLSRNGAYAVTTGPAHPVTLDQGMETDVLRGGRTSSGVSFNSLRSYASNTDYFFGMPNFLHVSDPDFECVTANAAATPTVAMISDGTRDIGMRLSWELHRDSDHFLVEEILIARGDEFTNSAAEITFSVTNLGPTSARVGLRYAWALILGNRGGAASPTIGMRPPEAPLEPYYNSEQSLPHPNYRSYIVSLEDTPSNPGPIDDNEYVVEATLRGVPLVPPPTPPDRFLLTLFGETLVPPQPARFGPLNSCFAYDISEPPRPVYHASGTGVVYFWGEMPGTALVVLPGETASVTQYVFAYLDFPLVCDAGAPQVAECRGAITTVELDGSGSDNLVDGTVDYLWTTDDPAVTLENETSVRPLAHVAELGTHEVMLLAHQGGFATACTTEVEVVDTVPPAIGEAHVTPASLWPPNHRLVPVEITIDAWDRCDEDVDIRLVDVLSSEPGDVGHGGDGHTNDDIQEAEFGTRDFSVLLRAERQGGRAGRTYTLLSEVRDGSGNVTTVPITVSVSHDQRPTRRR
jgi:hypothetical protein